MEKKIIIINIYNLATNFISILDDIKKQEISEINCIYIAKEDEKEINLLHDYNEDINIFNEEYKKIYLEAKNVNKELFKKIWNYM